MIDPAFNAPIVPNEVIFGCAAVVNVPDIEINEPVDPLIGVFTIAPPVICALGVFRVVNEPVDPLIGVFTIAPPVIWASPVDHTPTVAVPLTFNPVNVPTEVIFGCAAVVNVPPILVASMVVKVPLDGVVAPIGVPFIAPPVI